VTSSPDTETFADAARLAAEAYAADSERHYHFLAAIVDACCASSAPLDAEEREVWTNGRDARTIEHKRSVAAEASLAVLRVAFLAETPGRGPGTFTPRLPESPEARVAAYVAAQAAIRAGCASLRVPVSLVRDSHSAEVPFFAVLAHVSLVSLTLETSGEEALAALALAADVASAASFLAPATFAPGRSDEQTRAATAVHPGMGRLASAMSGDSGRGAHLPRWAVGEDHSRALAETAAETLTTSEGSGSGSGFVFFRRDGEEDAAHEFLNASRGSRLIRAMFRCACGVMPPGMVTDVSAALFATWAACGDHVFGTWLLEALGGDKDGFPRRSTTREQKAFFARELLGTLGDVPGDAPERTSTREASPEAKMDLRRFKRCVKAFCGGKKVGK
jgi:hypothetical protein